MGRDPLETLYEQSYVNPGDKGLSLYWYAIETKAVAGYQMNVRSHVIAIR